MKIGKKYSKGFKKSNTAQFAYLQEALLIVPFLSLMLMQKSPKVVLVGDSRMRGIDNYGKYYILRQTKLLMVKKLCKTMQKALIIATAAGLTCIFHYANICKFKQQIMQKALESRTAAQYACIYGYANYQLSIVNDYCY
ncbi:MAG: hypothetical protein NT007_02950 [Candidatus Kapabacteria bacterium]|nr:hypothetical protein [Candidatus Kapabacteria bacterium]